MTRARRGARDLPSGMKGFQVGTAGAWNLVARPEHLDEARALLGPMEVEELIGLLSRTVVSGSSPGGAPARGGRLEVEEDGGRGIVVKALRKGGLPGKVQGGYYGRRRLLREMSIHREARERGAPLPELVFGAWGRRPDGSEIALLATERLPEAGTLADLLVSPPAGRGRERRIALGRAGAAIRRCHDAGLDHADLNIGNILLGGSIERAGHEVRVIDLGLSRVGEPLETGRRASNLVRLLRSAEKHLGAAGTGVRDAAALLRGYLRQGADPARRFRRDLLSALRRRLPGLALHRLGWALTRRSR